MKYIPDVLIVVGVVAFVVGFGLGFGVPAALMVTGGILVAFGWVTSKK